MTRRGRWAVLALGWVLFGWAGLAAGDLVLHVFPSGPIYDYRWKLLELALEHVPDGRQIRLLPYPEAINQDRSMLLLQSGTLDVVALGTNPRRQAALLPVRFDILRGILGYRVFMIRRSDQFRLARMSNEDMRRHLVFGLGRGWADLPIMIANGYTVEAASNPENLYAMLNAGRFDAFPRGINEVYRDLPEYQKLYPQLALESSKALYFPYPVYFWVNRGNPELARRIQRGLTLALKDGSFRKLFTTCYAAEIDILRKNRRQVLRLGNPNLPTGMAEPDTRWWWPSP
ncbi:MAG: hypothetical protein P4L36_16315 [Holophaga sp.]|nr:hypothetical protein [Holophaga sp.]